MKPEAESEAKLQSGYGFHLQPDGQWEVEKIPEKVLKEAKFSGHLTIEGYRSTVFETPDKDQWAQKSTGTVASRIAKLYIAQLLAADPKIPVKPELDRDAVKNLIAELEKLQANLIPEEGAKIQSRSSLDPKSVQKILNDLENYRKSLGGEMTPGMKLNITGPTTDIRDWVGRAAYDFAQEFIGEKNPNKLESELNKFMGESEEYQHLADSEFIAEVADKLRTKYKMPVPHGMVASQMDARTRIISSIKCATCKNFAWNSHMNPVRTPEKIVHHPACPQVRFPTVASRVAHRWEEMNRPPQVAVANIASRVAKQYLEAHIHDLDSGIQCTDVQIREFQPTWKVNSPYDTFDGKFTFIIPDGRTVVFDGRLDSNDQTGKMTVDGVDVSDQLWANPGDSASLEFLGLDTDLDQILGECIKAKAPELLEEPKPTVASRVAQRFLKAESRDLVSQIEKTLERDGDDKKYDKAIMDFVEDTRKLLPPLEKTLSKAVNEVMDIRSKIDHKHPKVKSVYVTKFLERMDDFVSKLTALQESINQDLGYALHGYEVEAGTGEED